jgi:hypothetical protein
MPVTVSLKKESERLLRPRNAHFITRYPLPQLLVTNIDAMQTSYLRQPLQ